MSQPRAPPPWPPRPIYLAHFLHPPGGSLHHSVPESRMDSPSRDVCFATCQLCSSQVGLRLVHLAFMQECRISLLARRSIALCARKRRDVAGKL